MTVRARILLFTATLGFVGCGESPTPPPPLAPLTVAEWKALPVAEKYNSEAIERLKLGDPALETPEGWEAFQKKVVIPARKKDFPNGKSR